MLFSLKFIPRMEIVIILIEKLTDASFHQEENHNFHLE